MSRMQSIRSVRDSIRRYGFHSAFVRILALVLAVSVVGNCLLGLFYYRRAYDRVQQEVLSSGELSLQRITNRIDEVYSHVYSSLFILAANNNVKALALDNCESVYDKLMAMKNTVAQLVQIMAENNLLSNLYLYLPEEGRILSNNGVGSVYEERYAADIALMDAFLMDNASGVQVKKTDEENPRLVFYVALPLVGGHRNTCLAFFIRIDAFYEYCSINPNGLADYLDVRDNTGNSLFNMTGEFPPEDPDNPGEEYIVISQRCNISNLSVIEIIHRRTLSGYLSSFARSAVSVMALFTLLLIALSYGIALKLYAPYALLTAEFASDSGANERNEISVIDRNLRNVISNSDRLSRIVEDNIREIRSGYLLGVLRSVTEESPEVAERKGKLYSLQVDLNAPFFQMMLLFSSDHEEDEGLELEIPMLIDILRRLFPNTEYVFYSNDIILALVASGEEDRAHYCEIILDEMRSLLQKKQGIICRVLCTSVCGGIAEARGRFNCLRSAVRYGFIIPPWKIESIEDIEMHMESGRELVSDAKDKILYLCSQADAKGACDAAEALFSSISIYANPERLLDFFFAQMIASLEFDFLKEDNMSDRLHSLFQEFYTGYCEKRDYYALKGSLTDILSTLCEEISSNRMKARSGKMQAAKEYISNHFMQDISLEDVAQAAGLSASYFSSLFADVEGTTFKEYLTRVRIHHASAMLIDGGFPLEEIMKQCGFTNTATFYRVFKRNTGYSPRQYHNRFAEQKDEE